jgi:hypothetical protein
MVVLMMKKLQIINAKKGILFKRGPKAGNIKDNLT